jgi:hypothetical protein
MSIPLDGCICYFEVVDKTETERFSYYDLGISFMLIDFIKNSNTELKLSVFLEEFSTNIVHLVYYENTDYRNVKLLPEVTEDDILRHFMLVKLGSVSK